MFYFYIFKCKDGTLYCGSTKDIKKREKLHNEGKGAKYTRSRGGGKVIYTERFRKWGNALRREIEVKKFTRTNKLNLIKMDVKKDRN
jgi:putative endonuclease